jgi:hypothetical protein
VRVGVLSVGGAKLRLLDFFVFVRARLIGVRHWFVPLSGFSRLDAELDEGTPWAAPAGERRIIAGEDGLGIYLVYVKGASGLSEGKFSFRT